MFGGTFNPIHLGHLLVADDVRERLALDRMLFVPAAVPPHKPPDDLAPALDRFEMTRLAVAAHPLFAVSDVELSRPGPSYTVDTLRLLGAAGDELHLLIGSETFLDLPHWRAPREVVSLARLVVVPRTGDGFDPDSPAAQRVLRELGLPPFCHGASPESQAPVLVRAASLPISGSDLRRRAQEGRSLAYRLPEAVIAHIRERGLYRVLAAPTAGASSGAGPSSR